MLQLELEYYEVSVWILNWCEISRGGEVKSARRRSITITFSTFRPEI